MRLFAIAVVSTLALGASSARALIYYTQPGSAGGTAAPSAPTQLYSANEDGTGGFTLVGNVTVGGVDVALASIAMDRRGDLYGFEYGGSPAGSRLIQIDPTNGNATVLGAGTYVPAQLTGAAFDRLDRLWVFDITNGQIREFDVPTLALVGTGIAIPTDALPSGQSVNGGDLAFSLDGTCYFLGTSSTNGTNTPLYTVDLVMGRFASLGTITLMGFASGGALPGIAFSLRNDTCAEVLMAGEATSTDEAGIVDLTMMPPVLTQTATTGVDISWWNQPDLAGFASGLAVPACFSCGDTTIDAGEECDDGNTGIDDGCDGACLVETGWTCMGAPSTCTSICGDGLMVGMEGCDDGNTDPMDGCSPTCTVELDDSNPCTDAAECRSGFCVDGVCCDTLCDGLCVACDVDTAGRTGTCAPVPAGEDPADECAGTLACDGMRACEAGSDAGMPDAGPAPGADAGPMTGSDAGAPPPPPSDSGGCCSVAGHEGPGLPALAAAVFLLGVLYRRRERRR